MAKGTLRGYRWWRTTTEPDRDTDLADRVAARFGCTRGHEFTVHCAAGADLPASSTRAGAQPSCVTSGGRPYSFRYDG
jgi:hypothetical protein